MGIGTHIIFKPNGSGTYDHSKLINRNLPDQHTFASITGGKDIVNAVELTSQPTYFEWDATNQYYIPTVYPQGFDVNKYNVILCAFVTSNPISNPKAFIGGVLYDLVINNQTPGEWRISDEEICYAYIVGTKMRLFGLDTNRATSEEAIAGVDNNKYITPKTLIENSTVTLIRTW